MGMEYILKRCIPKLQDPRTPQWDRKVQLKPVARAEMLQHQLLRLRQRLCMTTSGFQHDLWLTDHR